MYLVLFIIVGHEVRIVLGNKKKADTIIQGKDSNYTTYFDALILCKADGTGGRCILVKNVNRFTTSVGRLCTLRYYLPHQIFITSTSSAVCLAHTS